MDKCFIQLFRIEDKKYTKDYIEKLIGDEALKEIRFFDEHPVFNIYTIAHEGIAQDNRGRIYNYLSTVIKKLFNKLKKGTDIFFRHTENESPSREVIGKVVGKELVEENGILSTNAVIYIKPNWRGKQLDIASIEAMIMADQNSGEVLDIDEISGIALSNSTLEDSGFPNAKLLESLAFFAKKQEEGTEQMTIQEMKDYIKANNTSITELFDLDNIMSNEDVNKVVLKKLQEKHEHARRVEEKLGNEIIEKENLVKKLKEYEGKIWNIRIKENLKEIGALKKLDEKVINYLEEKVSKKVKIDELQDEEKLKEILSTELDAELEEFNKMRAIFGIETKKEDDKKADDENKGGGKLDKKFSPPSESTPLDDNELVPDHIKEVYKDK